MNRERYHLTIACQIKGKQMFYKLAQFSKLQALRHCEPNYSFVKTFCANQSLFCIMQQLAATRSKFSLHRLRCTSLWWLRTLHSVFESHKGKQKMESPAAAPGGIWTHHLSVFKVAGRCSAILWNLSDLVALVHVKMLIWKNLNDNIIMEVKLAALKQCWGWGLL